MRDASEPQVSRDWAWPGPGNLHGAWSSSGPDCDHPTLSGGESLVTPGHSGPLCLVTKVDDSDP